MRKVIFLILLLVGVASTMVYAEEPFSQAVGRVRVGEVQTGPLEVPYITWGGDIATFHANGGLRTRPGTIFGDKGLNLNLKPGDNFVQQVRDYMSGKSPFLRGTFRMMGLASEVIGSDPRTKGVVLLQMTYSAGDHLVVRKGLKSISDLKGKTIVLQKYGPHLGMLDDILKTANMSWEDVKIIWAKDLTASKDSPAELFRSKKEIDGCFVITPDMIGLCGGLSSIGTGAEGTVEGSKVLVSTSELSRSIADVYVCRKDFFDSHKDLVIKFVSGYFKSCEEVLNLKSKYESKDRQGVKDYLKLLQLSQDIYGRDAVPTLEEDAHGLLLDCRFVGYPGNVSFFTDTSNLNGFKSFQKSALKLASSRGYIRVENGLFSSGLDYKSPEFTKYLSTLEVKKVEKFRAEAVVSEIENLNSGELDDKTIISFTIEFSPNQKEFSMVQYGSEYQRVVEVASKYGNGIFAIRGHSDPTRTLSFLVRAGINKGILKRSGQKGDYKYFLNGRPFQLEDTPKLVSLINEGAFDGDSTYNPRQVMQSALNLSYLRAEAVRKSILEYAKSKNLPLDPSQMQPVGVGIKEPLVAKPESIDEAKQNMRVEFRLIRVEAEASKSSDFDF